MPHRRDFLKQTALAVGGLGLMAQPQACAIEPLKRSGKPRLALSLAAYSFRSFFRQARPADKPADPARELDMFKFVDYCAEHGCDGAEVTSYYFPRPLTTDYLLQLRRHAFLRGIPLSGTAVGNNFARPKGEELNKEITQVKQWIDYAALLGAPHIRIFAGPQPKELPRDEARSNCIAAIEECCAYAGQKGIVLGLENHGGIVAQAADLLELVKAVKSEWFGINLDTGNFVSEDPYQDLAACAPYAVNVQVKADIRRRGAPKAELADIPRLMKMLREANYQGYVALEYESAEDPWTAVPRLLKEMKAAMAAS